MRYDAFISYSHAADGELAPALQNALQRLAKPWYRRRALEVFRDETGLAVDPHLWGAIVNALEQSEWFVLLTSPAAADSEWVNREIDHWKDTRPLDRILPVVTDGHWEWDSDAGDFTEGSDAVPPALRGVFDDEPRHLDLRWARGESQLDLRNGKFRDAAAELAAPLHGRTKDDLEGEDIRQHRRTLRLAWGAAAALALFAIATAVGAGVAVRSADEAQQRRVEADAQRLVAQSSTVPDQPDLAFLLAAHAHRLDPTPDTEGALLTALGLHPEFRQRLQIGRPVTAVAEAADADLVAIGTDEGDLYLHRFSDGMRIAAAEDLFSNFVVNVDIDTAQTPPTIVAHDFESVALLNTELETVDTLQVPTGPEGIMSLDLSPTGTLVAAGTTHGKAHVWGVRVDQPASTIDAHPSPDSSDLNGVLAVAFAPDGTLVTAGQGGGMAHWDPSQPDEPLWVSTDQAVTDEYVTAIAVTDSGRVTTGGQFGSVRFWSLEDGSPIGDPSGSHAGTVTSAAPTGAPPDEGARWRRWARTVRSIYWNDRTGFPISPTPGAHAGPARAVGWDPNESQHRRHRRR